ncbi:tRNA (adenosine(37)-N6)-threonylcarbamoyltransferase complex ATPase subunit type 1 TsaE [Candidatus Kaiserbacteria bacterium]|nr:tRNA (adenosine(37)-N6)-threonylcarbamoyltransferase complex ATPase subunit type 1 TsaE [Candidatus Kaiserbacteria bacterium]
MSTDRRCIIVPFHSTDLLCGTVPLTFHPAVCGDITKSPLQLKPARQPLPAGALFHSAVQLAIMEKTIQTVEELETEAKCFVEMLVLDGKRATLVTLSGELGAGKTAFTKAVAHALGVEDVVTSPTFVLEKIYALPQIDGHVVSFKRLVHIDAYRLEKGADLAPLGFDELMKDSDNLILLEWPEKVGDALPEPAVKISIIANTDGSRVITYG